MTQQYGLESMTDSDGVGDGKLDTWASGGSTSHPAYPKPTTDGATRTAYAGMDGETWSQVGTAQLPSANDTGDARLVVGEANAKYPGEKIEAAFSGFFVTSRHRRYCNHRRWHHASWQALHAPECLPKPLPVRP